MSAEPKAWLEEMMRDLLRHVSEDEQASQMAPLAGALKDELLRRGWYWSQYAEDYVSPRSGALPRACAGCQRAAEGVPIRINCTGCGHLLGCPEGDKHHMQAPPGCKVWRDEQLRIHVEKAHQPLPPTQGATMSTPYQMPESITVHVEANTATVDCADLRNLRDLGKLSEEDAKNTLWGRIQTATAQVDSGGSEE